MDFGGNPLILVYFGINLIKWVVIDYWCLNAPGTTGPNQVLLNGICL